MDNLSHVNRLLSRQGQGRSVGYFRAIIQAIIHTSTHHNHTFRPYQQKHVLTLKISNSKFSIGENYRNLGSLKSEWKNTEMV